MASTTSSWPRVGLVLSCLISSASASASASASVGNEVNEPKPEPHPEAFRTLSLALSITGSSLLAFCVARRTSCLRSGATPSRRLIFAILMDSWVFIFFSALMTSGIGLSLNSAICGGAISLCMAFYGLSKVLIYMFHADRVYTVHAGANRLQSTTYRICLVFLLGFGVVVSLMIWGRIAFPFTKHIMDGSDHACVIGVNRHASIFFLVVDLFLGVLFTALFLYPLYRSRSLTAPLRRLAKRTLWGALVALVTSAANVSVLMILHRPELGWVCFASCTADVTITALALFFVTGSYDDHQYPKFIDIITTAVIRCRSAMPILQTSSVHQPGASHHSVHFPNTEQHAPEALESVATQTIRSIVGIPPEEGPPSRQQSPSPTKAKPAQRDPKSSWAPLRGLCFCW